MLTPYYGTDASGLAGRIVDQIKPVLVPALPSGVLAGSVPMLAGAAKGTSKRRRFGTAN